MCVCVFAVCCLYKRPPHSPFANISNMQKGTQEGKNKSQSTCQQQNQQPNTHTRPHMDEISSQVKNLDNRTLELERQMASTVSQLSEIESEIKSTITCRCMTIVLLPCQPCCDQLNHRVCFKPAPIEGKTYVNVLGCGWERWQNTHCMDMAQLKHTYVAFMPAGMLFVTFVAFRCVSVPFAKQWWWASSNCFCEHVLSVHATKGVYLHSRARSCVVG